MQATLAEVEAAVSRGQIGAAFQPIVNLRTGRVESFEVLARWNSPEHGPCLPLNFIDLAESAKLLDTLTDRILDLLIGVAHTQPSAVTFSINVSAAQFTDPGFVERLRAKATGSGLSLARLAIEITETTLLCDLDAACANAVAIKALGCKLALDDFGAGYLNYLHIQALPFDYLKIDRAIVTGIGTDRGRHVLASIVDLCHRLGLNVVAEGVEEVADADLLLWLGCDAAQGWLFGRPGGTPTIAAAARRAEEAGRRVSGEGVVVRSPANHLAQLRAIFTGAPLGMAYIDDRLRLLSANTAFLDLVGPVDGDFAGRSIEAIAPDWFARVKPFLIDALHGTPLHEKDISGWRPGGSETALLASFEPSYVGDGHIEGAFVALAEMGRWMRDEQALVESAIDYAKVQMAAPEDVWRMDAQGFVTASSPHFREITGLSDAASRRLGWSTIVHPEDLPAAMEATREAIHFGKPINVCYRIRTKEGAWLWVRAKASPEFDRTGRIVHWNGSTEFDADSCKPD